MAAQEKMAETLTQVLNGQKREGTWIKVTATIIAAGILGGVVLYGDVRALKNEMALMREDVRDLESLVRSQTDDRWRKGDHDIYAQLVERRLLNLEKNKAWTQNDIEQVVRGILRYPWEFDKPAVLERLKEIERRIEQLEKGTNK